MLILSGRNHFQYILIYVRKQLGTIFNKCTYIVYFFSFLGTSCSPVGGDSKVNQINFKSQYSSKNKELCQCQETQNGRSDGNYFYGIYFGISGLPFTQINVKYLRIGHYQRSCGVQQVSIDMFVFEKGHQRFQGSKHKFHVLKGNH